MLRPLALAAALIGLPLTAAPTLAAPKGEAAPVRLPMPKALEHPVEIEAVELPLLEVVRRLKDLVGLNAIFDEGVLLRRPVSIRATGSLREVLNRLAEQQGLAYKAYNDWTLLFFPDSPKKRWAYSDENPMNGPRPRLPDAHGRAPLANLEAREASLLELFEAIDEASPLRFRFDVSIDLAQGSDFVTERITVQEGLDLLMFRFGLTYQLRYEDLVLVYPASFEKMEQHRDPRVEGVAEKGPPPDWTGR